MWDVRGSRPTSRVRVRVRVKKLYPSPIDAWHLNKEIEHIGKNYACRNSGYFHPNQREVEIIVRNPKSKRVAFLYLAELPVGFKRGVSRGLRLP